MTTVLRDNLEAQRFYTVTGTVATVAGRNGNGMSVTGSSGSHYASFPLLAPDSTITMGAAVRLNSMGVSNVFRLTSNSNTNAHGEVLINNTGSVQFNRSGTLVGTASATGLITANTWAFIEFQCYIHDTLGTATIRVNGTPVVTLTNVDTHGTGAFLIDTVRLTGTTNVATYDDLYIKIGAGETFDGDTGAVVMPFVLASRQSTRVAVVTPGAAQNYRQSLRAAIRTFGPFLIQNVRQAVKVLTGTPTTQTVRNYRQSVRVLSSLAPLPNEARLARLSARVLHSGGTSEARLARISLRSVIAVIASVGGAVASYWNGTAFADGPVRTWTGSAFVDSPAVKTWSGTAWV